MIPTDPVLTCTLEILMRFSPRSVFVYGSRGRGDFNTASDYEVGVVFDTEHYIDRKTIHGAVDNTAVKVYPFKWEDLENGNLNILFQKSLYLRELKLGAKLLYGDDILTRIPVVPITLLDLLQRTRFDLGLALASLLSFRAGDKTTSMEEFSKSCLFGLRSLLIFENKQFPVGYDEIYESSKYLDLNEDIRLVIDAAIKYRLEGIIPEIDIIYENISFIDSFIEPKLLERFAAEGNVELL